MIIIIKTFIIKLHHLHQPSSSFFITFHLLHHQQWHAATILIMITHSSSISSRHLSTSSPSWSFYSTTMAQHSPRRSRHTSTSSHQHEAAQNAATIIITPSHHLHRQHQASSELRNSSMAAAPPLHQWQPTRPRQDHHPATMAAPSAPPSPHACKQHHRTPLRLHPFTHGSRSRTPPFKRMNEEAKGERINRRRKGKEGAMEREGAVKLSSKTWGRCGFWL